MDKESSQGELLLTICLLIAYDPIVGRVSADTCSGENMRAPHIYIYMHGTGTWRVNTLLKRQNGRQFTDDIFISILYFDAISFPLICMIKVAIVDKPSADIALIMVASWHVWKQIYIICPVRESTGDKWFS